jgi:hypothetical protein
MCDRQIMAIERAQRRIERLLDQIDEAEASGNWPEVKNLAGDVLDVDVENVDEVSHLRASRRGTRYHPCIRHATVN